MNFKRIKQLARVVSANEPTELVRDEHRLAIEEYAALADLGANVRDIVRRERPSDSAALMAERYRSILTLAKLAGLLGDKETQ